MAKLKMKTVTIIALRKDRKRLIEHLQDSAIVELKLSKNSTDGFKKVDFSSQAQIFGRNAANADNALAVLDKISPEKKGLLSSFEGRREISSDDLGKIAANAPNMINVCNCITALNKQCAANAASEVRARSASAQLEPWRNLDIPFNESETKLTSVLIGSVQRREDESSFAAAVAAADNGLIFDFEIVSSSDEITCFVLAVPKSMKGRAENALREIGYAKPSFTGDFMPTQRIKELDGQLKQLAADTENAKEKIASFADKRRDIEDARDYFKIRADKYEVIDELDHSNHTFVISGYVPEADCEKLTALCERVATCAVEYGDAPDDAPVKLRNNKFAEPAQGIVMMYSAPSHDDIDPTPLLAFFFYLFFGMMFSDAGYGLLMVIATAVLLKKYNPENSMKNNLKLFQYCGISTFIWGLIYGSIFGDAPAAIYNYITHANITMAQLLPWHIIDQQKDAMTIMIMSISFGLVHILVGMGCKFYICWRKGDKKDALFDTGLWMLMLVGLAVLAAGMKFGKTVMYTGMGIAIFCAVGLILTQGRDKKNIFGKFFGGIISLYDITGYISDLLSYSRLLALGLTTGVMAEVFNLLATMIGSSWWGIVPMVLIFIIGHLINIGLNALGSYVHTLRLQYVEMFGKFYEGGGKEFEPFTLESKYVRIQEDRKK